MNALPWNNANVNDEARWFGTEICLTAKIAKHAVSGLVREGIAILHSVKNGGGALEVKFKSDDFPVRINARDTYDVSVLLLKDAVILNPVIHTSTPIVRLPERPNLGFYTNPRFVASAAEQKLLCYRSGRIALLRQLNDKLAEISPVDAYHHDDISHTENENIDKVRDYLIENIRLLSHPVTS
ncbi:hypothetical protein [Methylomonas sp. AM2-LC]|uniref:hypothetical protein n=1 Tax=Methylomonas sp. AM2-LC TaxID=3153301 RepID=UPI0032661780